jgi:hypothetical protein
VRKRNETLIDLQLLLAGEERESRRNGGCWDLVKKWMTMPRVTMGGRGGGVILIIILKITDSSSNQCTSILAAAAAGNGSSSGTTNGRIGIGTPVTLSLSLNFILLNVLPSHLMEHVLSLLMQITILFAKLS